MRPRRQLLGVGRIDALEAAVQALGALGAECAWVVHGEDGLDEISTCAATRVCALESGKLRHFTLEPGEFVPCAEISDLAGGDPQQNAAIARDVISGKTGPARDVVLLNAAAALVVAGAASDLPQGVARAASSIDSGEARGVLERWIAFCAEEPS